MNGLHDRHVAGRILRRCVSACVSTLALVTLLSGMAYAGQAPDAPTRAPDTPVKRVLIISTGKILTPGLNVISQQIVQALNTLKSMSVETDAENLDISRFPSEESQRVFRQYLEAKYAEHPPDLVVLILVGTLGMSSGSLRQLFPQTPILVAGFSPQGELRPEQFGKSVTGFLQRFDAPGTLDLMVRLQPGLRRIVVIGGTSDDDRLRL
jgi:hypothetical protein